MGAWLGFEGLGTPSYERAGVRIYQGDSLELLERVSTPLINLTVTSPPYNIGKEYEEPLPLEKYLEWCGRWLNLLHDATAATGALWLNLGYISIPGRARAVPLPYLLWERSPYFLHQEVVWQYGAGVASRKSFSPRNEKWLWYLKNPEDYYFDLDAVRDPDVKYPNQTKNGKPRCNPLGKNPGDVWSIPKVTSGTGRSSAERAPHPAQFPEAVIERIVLASSRPGDLILDPFLGSGTTAAVAARLGRRCIGIESREDYVSHAIRRVEGVFNAGIRDTLPLIHQ